MPKCIVFGFTVSEKELKECEKEHTNGIYCSACLFRMIGDCIQSAFQTLNNKKLNAM